MNDTITRVEAVFAAFEQHSKAEPELNKYRTPAAPCEIPDGWHISDTLRHIIQHDAWWPRHERTTLRTHPEPTAITDERPPPDEPQLVSWIRPGPLGSPESNLLSPMLRIPQPSAPLLISFRFGMEYLNVFPDEACMLESFLITYEETGFMDDPPGEVDMRFPEWILNKPKAGWNEPPLTHMNVHRKLKQLSTQWTTNHPLWDPNLMPFHTHNPIPEETAAILNGSKIC